MTVAAVSSDLTAAEAEECIEGIRGAVTTGWEWIARAVNGRAWIALGYPSWDAMCEDRLAGVRLALPSAERREAVADLRTAGLSTRAIASGLGISQATAARDARESNDSPASVTGTDGKTYPPKAKVTEITKTSYEVDTRTGEISEPKPAQSPARRPEPSPAAAAAQREREDARQLSDSVANSLLVLDGLHVEAFRRRVLDFWALDHSGTPPTAAACFTPEAMRRVAAGLLTLADELETR